MKKMDKYVCLCCSYIYNPQKGDPSQNIPAETAFEELPGKWVCPICFVKKNEFKKW